MRKKVVVIGGGVAGLTAAHELIERGFDVDVYERRERFGGKATSVDTQHGFPAEHGFRFFPGWYQHLPDTMKNIPYKDQKHTVYQNLVKADTNLFATYDDEPIRALLRLPTSIAELKTAAAFPPEILRLGVTPQDFIFFFRKLFEFAVLPEDVRLAKFDTISWWDFMEANQESGPLKKSEPFKKYLVDGITRNTVAADPRKASAYTIASVALRTISDTLRPDTMVDRVLNGPTREVWFDPWVRHLEARGVNFFPDAELDSIQFDGRRPRIESIKLSVRNMARRRAAARVEALRTLKVLTKVARLEGHEAAEAFRNAIEEFGGADLDDQIAALEQECLLGRSRFDQLGHDVRVAYANTFGETPDWGELQGRYEGAKDAYARLLREIEQSPQVVRADYFVFALPVEQMAYYVNRSEMMRKHDPDLTNIIRLSEHVEWMAGIQFYLTEDVKLTSGHIDCLDSEWHLTAISQAQFWSEVDLKERGNDPYRGRVKAILSVDISAWDQKGQVHDREAFACTPQQIAEEVWDQLKRSLNRANQAQLLRDDMLLDEVLGPSSYYLDDNIADRLDRKKQAFYKKLESVRFSSVAVAARQDPVSPPAPQASFAYGDRQLINAEPLLVNRPGAHALRPTAATKIENMFLAADYVRTNTNLATMEGANEAARVAVNAILRKSGSTDPLCRLFTLWQPTDALRLLGDLLAGGSVQASLTAVPARLAGEAASAVSAAAEAAKNAIGRWIDRRR